MISTWPCRFITISDAGGGHAPAPQERALSPAVVRREILRRSQVRQFSWPRSPISRMILFRDFLRGWRLKRRFGLARQRARRADEFRDAPDYCRAAEAYRAVLVLAPSRTDIRVQYANMLKDAGRLAEAESAYRSALAEKPDNADIHLQLGHCLKLQGRRTAALAAYERAAKLARFSIAPQHELFHMGQRRNQEYLFEANCGSAESRR